MPSPSWSYQDVQLLSRWQPELQESGYGVCVAQHQTLLAHRRRETGATDPLISVLSRPVASPHVFLLQGVTSVGRKHKETQRSPHDPTFCDLIKETWRLERCSGSKTNPVCVQTCCCWTHILLFFLPLSHAITSPDTPGTGPLNL